MTGEASSSIPRHFGSDLADMLRFCGASELLEAYGLDPGGLADPEAMVPTPLYYDLVERAETVSGDPHLGLHFTLHAYETRRTTRGAAQFLVLSSPCLKVGFERLDTYRRYWNSGEWCELVEDGGTYRIRHRAWGPPRPAHVHIAEKLAAHIALMVRSIDPKYRPLAVQFAHAQRGDQAELERVLGVAPTFDAAYTEIVLPLEVVLQPLARSSADLFQLSERYLAQQHATLPPEHSSHTQRARSAVQRLLEEAGFGHRRVADSVGCSLRTLSRRLAEEGTTLRAIVDEVRQARAQALLESGVTIAGVAEALGYSEPAAFQHAFKRWKGMSPKRWLDRLTAKSLNRAAPGLASGCVVKAALTLLANSA